MYLDAQADDLGGQSFNPEGTLTYSHHPGGFGFRVAVEVAPGDDATRRRGVMFVTVSAGQRVNGGAG
ncbi:Uncharacterised protein [Amycolatopsis camponoti]|uniref:Uncharacterized protein n=1 Tax=Amycolatopsis camponoti TaxID=2606593 RepID=A0A6I8M943_9PSEU|nr:hypothetical protein [Amycolatopsis camponoti]VVJ24094.1 Uncharacterised protein [Amycolatopsis camponoti]